MSGPGSTLLVSGFAGGVRGLLAGVALLAVAEAGCRAPADAFTRPQPPLVLLEIEGSIPRAAERALRARLGAIEARVGRVLPAFLRRGAPLRIVCAAGGPTGPADRGGQRILRVKAPADSFDAFAERVASQAAGEIVRWRLSERIDAAIEDESCADPPLARTLAVAWAEGLARLASCGPAGETHRELEDLRRALVRFEEGIEALHGSQGGERFALLLRAVDGREAFATRAFEAMGRAILRFEGGPRLRSAVARGPRGVLEDYRRAAGRFAALPALDPRLSARLERLFRASEASGSRVPSPRAKM